MLKIIPMIVSIIVIWTVSFASGKSVIIDGRVVAIAYNGISYNGYIYADLLVEKSGAAKSKSEIVFIRFSVPKSKWAKWLAELASVRHFSVRRAKVKKAEIIEHMQIDIVSIKIKEIPYWKILPGHEKIKLPYGDKVLAYESADWPIKSAF